VDQGELREEIETKLGKWFSFKEYIQIEFDLDTGTATVIPVGK
jgi:hypothetical protein